MKFQEKIIEIIKPHQASLKFKLPYSENFPVSIQYLDGDLVWQAFKKAISHECRLFTLVGKACLNKKKYNTKEYASINYYFQTHLRTSKYCSDDQVCNAIDHPNLYKYRVASDHCYDCTCARRIIGLFFETKNVLPILDELVASLSTSQTYCGVNDAKTKNEY